MAEKEDGDDGDEQVGQVLLPPLGSRAWGPEKYIYEVHRFFPIRSGLCAPVPGVLTRDGWLLTSSG